MPTLVLIRHGQSQWNLENRFTGWWDVDLSPLGVEEARAAGALMRDKGLDFDCCFTSVLTRAIRTLHLALHTMDRLWLPVTKDWRLNERHYGGLTGLNKAEMIEKVGAEQVKIWRRSFDVPPPPLPFAGRRDGMVLAAAVDPDEEVGLVGVPRRGALGFGGAGNEREEEGGGGCSHGSSPRPRRDARSRVFRSEGVRLPMPCRLTFSRITSTSWRSRSAACISRRVRAWARRSRQRANQPFLRGRSGM